MHKGVFLSGAAKSIAIRAVFRAVRIAFARFRPGTNNISGGKLAGLV
jgi:hypothetical protein